MVQSIETTQTQQAPQSGKTKGDPGMSHAIRWAIMALIESVDTGFRTAETQAKRLSANGNALHKVIDEEKACKWHHVPTYKEERKRFTHYRYMGHDSIQKYYTWQKVGSNQSKIIAAEQANQQESKKRQQLQGKMAVLQQLGQVGETRVNTTVNTAAQTMQETSSLVQMVDNLTRLALIKRH